MSLDLGKTFKDKVSKPLAASALALSMAFSPMAANDVQAADDVERTKVATSSSYDLAKRAQNYSETNKNAIGFYLNMGPEDTLDPKEFGLNVRKMFAQDGFKSNFTYSFAQKGETSISFFVDGVPYDGYGMDKLEEGYNKALKHAKHIKDTDLIASNTVAYNND